MGIRKKNFGVDIKWKENFRDWENLERKSWRNEILTNEGNEREGWSLERRKRETKSNFWERIGKNIKGIDWESAEIKLRMVTIGKGKIEKWTR